MVYHYMFLKPSRKPSCVLLSAAFGVELEFDLSTWFSNTCDEHHHDDALIHNTTKMNGNLYKLCSSHTWNATPSLCTTAFPPPAKPVPSLRISTNPGFGPFSFSFLLFFPSLSFGFVVSGTLLKSASHT